MKNKISECAHARAREKLLFKSFETLKKRHPEKCQDAFEGGNVILA